jgi:hypothetical protein
MRNQSEKKSMAPRAGFGATLSSGSRSGTAHGPMQCFDERQSGPHTKPPKSKLSSVEPIQVRIGIATAVVVVSLALPGREV